MRIAINGWFWQQLTTGSGQYLAALAEWLPRAEEGHEYVLVKPANSKSANGKSANGKSANGKSANGKSANGKSANGKSANGKSANRKSANPDTQSAIQVLRASTPFDGLNSNLAKLWFEQIAFPRACRRLGADVAFVPYWGSPWWRPCPVVVTVHDIIPLILPVYRGGPLQRGYTWLVGRTARRAHAVITDSAASQRDIIAHLRIPTDRVHAVHLAVDPRFRPVTDPDELARVRVRYHLPDDPFLLYLGGFDERKNVVRMVEAFARYVENSTADGRPPIKLVIAGKLPGADTPFAPDPRPVVERLGFGELVHFAGWVDEADKPALYSLARAALFVSEYEGFGLPVLEAMGCGCGVVGG